MKSIPELLSGTVRPLARLLPRGTRSRIRRRLHEAEVRYLRWRYDLGPEALGGFLGELGVREGDVLFVHSSFDAFRGFEDLPPLGVVEVLEEVLGSSGALLMPTLPFAGSAVDYVKDDPVFDVRRTPSRMGLLTELFRRMPGVVRSVHPTHSAAVRGPGADELIADHHRAGTPCGAPSPYQKLLARDGKILFLGTTFMAMTFFHTVDEILEDELPFEPFTGETYRLWSVDAEGNRLETNTRLYNPEAAEARRKFEESLPRHMKAMGTWSAARLGNLEATLLRARDVLEALRSAVP